MHARLLLAACAAALLLAGCRVDAYSNLSEAEANEMIAVLSAQRITAGKTSQGEAGWQLQVNEADLGRALELLRGQGLPHERFVSLGDMFQKQGLVSTPAEERMRYIHGVSQELSRTLLSIDGVVAARVHVVIPANDPLSDKLRPSSAAVFIKHDAGTDLRTLQPAVKDMVAHSIEGLNHDQVSVTLFEARRRPAEAEAAGSSGSLFGVLPTSAQWIVTIVVALGLASLAALPFLLRRQGLGWREWLQRVMPRRAK